MNTRARRARYILRTRRAGHPVTGPRTITLYRTGRYNHLVGPLTRGYLGALMNGTDPFTTLAPLTIEKQEPEERTAFPPMTGFDFYLVNKYAPRLAPLDNIIDNVLGDVLGEVLEGR